MLGYLFIETSVISNKPPSNATCVDWKMNKTEESMASILGDAQLKSLNRWFWPVVLAVSLRLFEYD